MRRTLRTLLLLTTLLTLTAPVIPVQADVAPPENPPVQGILPEQKTRVQMVAEEVVFELSPMDDEFSDTSLLQMAAKFEMRNQGSESETMRVGFPEGCDPLGNESTVTVNGQQVEVTQEEGEVIVLYRENVPCESNSWLRFDATFPPEETVEIVVNETYHVFTQGSYIYYSYILETGADWYGPIGKGAIVFNLPYAPDTINFQGSWDSSLILSRKYADHSVQFTFNNLDPNENNNLQFVIGNPYYWQMVDAALSKVSDDPRDPQEYIQLGQAYEDASTLWRGTDPAVVDLALKAYNHALRLDPYAADAHIGVASVILRENTENRVGVIDIYSDPFKPVLGHLAKALALDPSNETGLLLLEWLGYYTDEAVELPRVNPAWLPTSAPPTETLTPSMTLTPSITLTPSMTLTPPNTLTPSITPTPTIYFSKTPGPTRLRYHTFTPEPKRGTPTSVVYKPITPTGTQSVEQQPTTQTRLVLYLILIGLMAGAGFVMWRREQV